MSIKYMNKYTVTAVLLKPRAHLPPSILQQVQESKRVSEGRLESGAAGSVISPSSIGVAFAVGMGCLDHDSVGMPSDDMPVPDSWGNALSLLLLTT